jgi:hypothetical protein
MGGQTDTQTACRSHKVFFCFFFVFFKIRKVALNGIILVRHTLCNEDEIYSVQCDQSFYSQNFLGP